MKHLTPILCLFLFCGKFPITAQEVISSGGANASASGITLSWTIGEAVTETVTNGSYTLTQGFHQSRLSATAINEIPLPGVKLSVFPNPILYILNIKVDSGDYSHLQYSLYDMDGKVLSAEKISKSITQVDMFRYASGNYLIRIGRSTGGPVKTFKVVKQ